MRKTEDSRLMNLVYYSFGYALIIVSLAIYSHKSTNVKLHGVETAVSIILFICGMAIVCVNLAGV